MYGSLDISTSGMIAQRTRLEVIAANIANKDTLLNAKGQYEPYLRREIMFAPGDPGASDERARGLGVHVVSIDANPRALEPRFAPGSPYDQDGDGYIMAPSINPILEQVNAMDAVRAYEANVAAAQAQKTMLTQALRLLA